jgi:hypothetical protein
MVQQAEKDTYITQEMRDSIGVEKDKRVSFPVAASDIRKWAIAVYWPETPPRLFWDEEYAKTTPFGGIIAPHEFNPFAWPPERPADISQGPSGPATAPGTRPLNGGSETVYHRPIRPGDVITSVSKVAEIYEKPGRLGRFFLTITENTWTNQDGAIVAVRRSISIKY